jgi:hypothetical protein
MASSSKSGAARDDRERAEHAAQLRDEIDRSRTGDYVPDAEQEPAMARERRHGKIASAADADPAAPHAGRRGVGPAGVLLFLFAIAVLAALLIFLPGG